MNLNKVILGGRLTADPEIKKTGNGVAVTSFTIAVDRKYSKDSEKKADFITIVAWRQTAEFICKYFQKGKSILIVGYLQTRTWEDQNGQKRYATEVVAEEAQFVEKKSDGASPVDSPRMPSNSSSSQTYQGYSQEANSQSSPYSSQAVQFEEMTGDDDLPF
jgi:single-strand DNA-binding protein